jgi:hypothetical protein
MYVSYALDGESSMVLEHLRAEPGRQRMKLSFSIGEL